MAKDAGFTGLSGMIKTGCTLTPAYNSRFCQNHMDQACSLKDNLTACLTLKIYVCKVLQQSITLSLHYESYMHCLV